MKKSKPLPLFRAVVRSMALLVTLLIVGLARIVSAAPQLDSLAADQISVRELMRLDTEHAMRLVRERAGVKPSNAQATAKRVVRSMSGEPRLSAIYGVGRNLMAEVVLDHVIYLYRQGQALPVGVAAGEDVYLLTKISPSCVDIERSDAAHHLCIKTSQWAGK